MLLHGGNPAAAIVATAIALTVPAPTVASRVTEPPRIGVRRRLREGRSAHPGR